MIVLKPVPEKAVLAFLNALSLFGMGASWGGFESLAIPCRCAATIARATKFEPGGPRVRFHIGLEDVGDLIADLERGFAALAASEISPHMTKPSDIVMMDALALSRAIQAKQVSCVEVMKAYLDHIDALNPQGQRHRLAAGPRRSAGAGARRATTSWRAANIAAGCTAFPRRSRT